MPNKPPIPTPAASPEHVSGSTQEIEAQLGQASMEHLEALAVGLRHFLAAFFGSSHRLGAKLCDREPPLWAHHLARKAFSQLLPGIDKWEFHDSPRSDGQFYGLVFRLLNAPDAEAPGHAPATDTVLQWKAALLPLIPSILVEACAIEGEGKFEFFAGFGQGCGTCPLAGISESGAVNFGSPRFTLYFVMAALWPTIEELPTSTAIYQFLESKGFPGLGDLATFQRLLREFGVSRGTSGRPRSKTRRSTAKSGS